MRLHTLASTPAQSNSTSPNRESLHLGDGRLGIRFSNKLNETAPFARRYLDLNWTGCQALFCILEIVNSYVMNVAKWPKEGPKSILGNKPRKASDEDLKERRSSGHTRLGKTDPTHCGIIRVRAVESACIVADHAG